MFQLVEPRQRPERFRLNRHHSLSEGEAFLGLGGLGDVGSAKYPDARKLLGEHPNDGTLTNMDPASAWVWVPELGRWALGLDGSDDYIRTATDITNTTSFAFSVWLNPTYTIGSDWSIGSDSLNGWCLGRYGTTIRLYSGASSSRWTGSSGDFVLNTWRHYAGSYVAARTPRWAIWIDGVQQSPSADTSAAIASQSFFHVGYLAYASGWGYWQGLVADPIVWSGAATLEANIGLLSSRDPMLGGWILPPHRMSFPAAVAETPAIPSGSASLDGVAALAASGWRASAASGSLEAVAEAAAAGYRAAEGAGELAAVAAIASVGYRASAGSGSLDAVASLVAVGYAAAAGSGTLDAVAGIEAVGEAPAVSAVPEGSGTLTGVGSLNATGYRMSSGEASLDAEGSTHAAGYRVSQAVGSLDATAEIVSVGSMPAGAYVSLDAAASIAATGYTLPHGSPLLSAVVTLVGVGYTTYSGSASLSAVAALVAFGRAPLESINTPASRTRVIRREDRTRVIRREDRTRVIRREDRILVA